MRPIDRRRGLLEALALVALAFAVYAPALGAGFVFDDHLLLEGGMLPGPFSALWLSTSQYDYWPLSWSVLWAEWRLWGGAAAGWHGVNVALHGAAAVLLWRVLVALRVRGAWLAGLLFVVHPAAVESVAWIAELKNPLSASLFLAAILAWIRAEETGRRRFLAAALASFLLALLAKASVVMLPLVLLGIALARRRALGRRDLVRVAPFFALAAALGAVTLWFQWSNSIAGEGVLERGAAARVGGAAWALGSYVERAFFPVRLAFVYADWPVRPESPWFYVPLAVAVAAIAIAWRLRSGPARPLVLALAYHATMVLPVLGFLEIAYFHVGPVSNHLQYLALMGPVALAAAGAAHAHGRWPIPTRVAVAGALAALSTVTWRRAATFEDDLTLWRAASRDAPQSLYAAWMYADRLGHSGRRAEALGELAAFAGRSRDEATRRRARGAWAFHARLFPEAFAEALEAERLRPDPEFRVQMAQLFTRAGRAAYAITLLGPLVRQAPGNVSARYWLGEALIDAGRLPEAAAVLEEGCRIAPGNVQLRESLAFVRARLGAARAPPPPP